LDDLMAAFLPVVPPDAHRKPEGSTVFLLTNGERLESRRYLLTAESLKIDLGHQRRTIPLSALDLDATIAANHERRIELTIPRDRSMVFIGF
jgi:hypothetical protein